MPTRVAFFGATGGCANACLAYTIQNGISAIALARSAEKLTEQLKKRGISAEVIEKQLTIITGDVRDQDAVKQAIEFGGKGVDVVISGIGGVPTPQLSLFKPLTMTDPNICADAINTILTVMSQHKLPQDPLLVAISANGVLDDAPRDYPLLLTPLYRWMLSGVFDDKRAMEAALKKADPTGGYVIVRPSVLGDGQSKGLSTIRQGTTESPVLGWGISRDDVGLWMFERLVKDDHREAWKGLGACITY